MSTRHNTKKPAKPALPNRRPLSAIEADIIATQTNDAASLIKRGEYLIEAKESEQIAHGDWTRWLSNNFELSERTAQSQMQVARYVAGLAKTAKIAVLNLSKSALYKISHGDYHADCIPAILQEAGKRFLTPRDVDRVIYKYREEHKTPEEREAERLAAEERRDLIAKADLRWMPDGDHGDLKVETPNYIYKIVPRGKDNGDNKIFEPQRWWKDGSKFAPLAAHQGYVVPLDVAKAVCAKDVIEEAAQEAKWAAQEAEWDAQEAEWAAQRAAREAEWDAQETEGPEISEAASGADEHAEPEPDEEAFSQNLANLKRGAEVVTNKPHLFIDCVGAPEAEAFARAILTELGVDAPVETTEGKPDERSLAGKLFYALNQAFLLCVDQNNWLHLSNDGKEKKEFRSALKRLQNLREALPRLSRPKERRA